MDGGGVERLARAKKLPWKRGICKSSEDSAGGGEKFKKKKKKKWSQALPKRRV